MRQQDRHDEIPLKADSDQGILDPKKIPSAVLRRLIEEVRAEKIESATTYNRTHNRHNRGR